MNTPSRPIATVRSNAIANIVGRAWSAIMGFAFVPVYIRFLGIEAYGLIGFFVSVMAIFFFLDMGLSTAINREMARLHAAGEINRTGRDLLRTLELVYWAIGILLALGLIMAATPIADHWLKVDRLGVGTAATAIRIMGLVVLFRWPLPLYSGALLGLQRQVELNIVLSAAASFQAGGAAIILWLVSPTVEAFFVWQALASALQIGALLILLWYRMGGAPWRARFRQSSLFGIARFSLGVSGITMLSVLLTQSDKFLLSKMLPLEEFGYYSLAGSIASVFTIVASAIYGAVFPALSRLVALGDEVELRDLYHRSSQLLSILLFPAALTVVAFTPVLLRLFTGNDLITQRVDPLLKLLLIGNLLLATMLLPLALQLANGWTRLSLIKNLIAVVMFLPTLWGMAHRFGAVGAALSWIALTLGYLMFEIPIMHRRLLRGEKRRWYVNDVGLPACAAACVVLAIWLVTPSGLPNLVMLAVVGLTWTAAVTAAIVVSPYARAMGVTILRSGRLTRDAFG